MRCAPLVHPMECAHRRCRTQLLHHSARILLTALASLNVQEHHSFACAHIHTDRAAATRSRTSSFGAVSVELCGAPPLLTVRRRPAESQWQVRLKASPNVLWRCTCVEDECGTHGYAWHAQPACWWRVAPSGVNIVQAVNNRGVNDPFTARYPASFFRPAP